MASPAYITDHLDLAMRRHRLDSHRPENDTRDTREMPIVRDSDVVSWTDATGHHEVPYRPAKEWGDKAVERLLADLNGG